MPTEAEIQADLESQKVTFDEKQQEKVNQLIRDAQGRAGSEARREAAELKRQFDSLKEQLEQAKDDLSKAKTSSQRGEASDDIKALEATLKEMQSAHKVVQGERDAALKAAQMKDNEIKRANENTINIRKEIMLTQAVSKINPFDPAVVVSLVKDCFAWDADKGKFVVVDANSQQPRLNSSFDSMTIDEFFAEYAAKNPYMVKSGARSGTGATESGNLSNVQNGKFNHTQIFGKGSNSKLAAKLAIEDPKEYQRLKTLARQDGTINW